MATALVDVQIDEKRFGEREILRNMHFELAAGEVLAVLGVSGKGKTTLLRVAAGLDSNFAGQVSRPDRLAYVFQEPTLLPWRSVLENVTLPTNAYEGTCRELLAQVGLSDVLDHLPGQISLGQQRRVALARALAADPHFLILDEPFVSLDEKLAREALELVAARADKGEMAILIATHSLAEVARLQARVLRI